MAVVRPIGACALLSLWFAVGSAAGQVATGDAEAVPGDAADKAGGPASSAESTAEQPGGQGATAKPSNATPAVAQEPGGQGEGESAAAAGHDAMADEPVAPSYDELGDEELPPPPPPPPPPPEGRWEPGEAGHYTHEGFYLRLALGIGYGRTESDNIAYNGWGGVSSIGLGYAVIENLIVQLDYFGGGAINSRVDIDGHSSSSFIDVRTSAVGAGVTYYIMPINMYVSASAGVAWFAFDSASGGSQASSAGFGTQALIGKEFWVGADWGIGAAAQFMYIMADDAYDGSLQNLAGGLLFSASYN